MKLRDIFFNEQAHNADLFSSGLAIFYPMVLMRQKKPTAVAIRKNYVYTKDFFDTCQVKYECTVGN